MGHVRVMLLSFRASELPHNLFMAFFDGHHERRFPVAICFRDVHFLVANACFVFEWYIPPLLVVQNQMHRLFCNEKLRKIMCDGTVKV
jgi:hypothetical protein